MAAPISTVRRVGAIPQGAAMEDGRGMFPDHGAEGAFAVKGRSAAWWANWHDLGNRFIHIYKFPSNYVKISNKFLSFQDESPETLKNKKKTSFFGY